MCFSCVLDSAAGAHHADSEDDSPPPAVPQFHASVRFEGNYSGTFSTRIPQPLARTVGAGFLGREEAEVSESESAEVVGELANMFCGSVLSQLESRELFRITHPEVLRTSNPPSSRGESRWFDLGDGILSVSFEVGSSYEQD